MSTLRIIAAASITFSSLALGTNVAPNDPTQHGLTIFYKIEPFEALVANYSNGLFDHFPSSSYECGPDPDYPFHPSSFGCYNPALAKNETTPQDIFNYGTPSPICLTLGIAFEHLQWATWTHACWAHPYPAIDSPTGHAEAAFQSTALAFRNLVLYQHDKHILTLNNRIAELRLPADAEILVMRESLAQHILDIDTYYDAEIGKLPAHGGDHRNRWIRFNEQRDAKKKQLNEDAQKAIGAREVQFWKDSWVHRQKTVEIDHLVGEYFERWMGGRTQGGWDWAGMGEPEPAWPANFAVPLK
jgi:hypothetical protein